MKDRNNGKILIFTGSTTVEGVSVDVTLEVNTVDLILRLGAKAAVSSIGLSRQASGLVRAKVSRQQVAAVKAARTTRLIDEEARRNPHGYAIIQPHQGDIEAHVVAIYPTRREALTMKNLEKCQYVRGATEAEYNARKEQAHAQS